MKERSIVIKLGGSASTDERGVRTDYVRGFFEHLQGDLTDNFSRLAVVIGGGPRVRLLQQTVTTDEEKDLIGIKTLYEHAQQVGEILSQVGIDTCQLVPTSEDDARSIMKTNHNYAFVMGGLKVGQSTDAVAITAAGNFAEMGHNSWVVILSNVQCMYTDDPKTNPEAKPIRRGNITYLMNQGILAGDPAAWRPGMQTIVDPVAVFKLQGNDQIKQLFIAHCDDRESVGALLRNELPPRGSLLTHNLVPTTYHDQ